MICNQVERTPVGAFLPVHFIEDIKLGRSISYFQIELVVLRVLWILEGMHSVRSASGALYA